MDNKYEINSRWEELEDKIVNLLIETDNDLNKIDFLRKIAETDDPAFKELEYDLDCEARLFNHLLATIKFWKETICVTEEKSMKV